MVYGVQLYRLYRLYRQGRLAGWRGCWSVEDIAMSSPRSARSTKKQKKLHFYQPEIKLSLSVGRGESVGKVRRRRGASHKIKQGLWHFKNKH